MTASTPVHPGPPPPSLYSIAIFVHDIERAVEFYRDRLLLPLVKSGTFGAEFFPGGTHIAVHPAVHPDAKALVGRHTGITLYMPGLLHYCGLLHDRGVRFITEPTQQAWGIMAMVADPDGNVLALWEDRLPGEPAESVGEEHRGGEALGGGHRSAERPSAGASDEAPRLERVHRGQQVHIDQADGAS